MAPAHTGSPIFDQALNLLEFYRVALADAGSGFDRSYVSDGNIAWPDGPGGLIVQHSEIRPPLTPGSSQARLEPNSIGIDYWTILALRQCANVDDEGGFPSADEITNSAALILADRWALRIATWGLVNDPASPVQPCEWVQLITIKTVGPQGGLAGTQVDLGVRP